MDRSQFNLAGLEIQRAQVDPPSEAAAHLAEAENHYREVYETRMARYRTEDFEDVACCVHGQGLVEYYRAALLDLTPAERASALRRAWDHASAAAKIRAGLRSDGLDGPDTAKSVALLGKIALARQAVNRAAGAAGPDDISTVVGFGLEWRGLAPNSSRLIGSDGTADIVAAPRDARTGFAPVPAVGDGPDLRDGIRQWAASDALRVLVRAFNGGHDDPDELFDSAGRASPRRPVQGADHRGEADGATRVAERGISRGAPAVPA